MEKVRLNKTFFDHQVVRGFIAIVTLLALGTFVYAAVTREWTPDTGIVLGQRPGSVSYAVGQQVKTTLVATSGGGYIGVWEEDVMTEWSTVDHSTLYAQKYNSSGTAVWAAPVEIGGNLEGFGAQFWIAVSDSSDGAVVIWQTQNSASTDRAIYAGRVKSDGTLDSNFGGSGGKIIIDHMAGLSPVHGNLLMGAIPDGSGGMVYSYSYFTGGKDKMTIQRINSTGSNLWNGGGTNPANGTSAIYHAYSGAFPLYLNNDSDGTWNKNNMALLEGANSGKLMVAVAVTNLVNNKETVAVQRLNMTTGAAELTAGGIGLSEYTTGGVTYEAQIVSDQVGGAYISWIQKDYPNTYIDYLRIDGNGSQTTYCANNGDGTYQKRIDLVYTNLSTPSMVADNNGGVYWGYPTVQYSPDGDIKVVHSNSCINSPANILVSHTQGDHHNVQLASDGSSGVYVSWNTVNNTDSNHQIHLQHVKNSSETLSSTFGAGGALDYTFQPYNYLLDGGTSLVANNSGGTNGVTLAWYQDMGMLNTEYDNYILRIDNPSLTTVNDESMAWEHSLAPQTPHAVTMSAQLTQTLQLSDGSYVVAWISRYNNNIELSAERYNSSGVAQWNAGNPGTGILLYSGNNLSSGYTPTTFHLLKSGTNFLLALATYPLDSTQSDLYIQKYSAAGAALWNGGDMIKVTDDTVFEQMYPKMLEDGSGGAFLIWHERCNNGYVGSGSCPTQSDNIKATHFISDGSLATNWNTAGSGAYKPLLVDGASTQAGCHSPIVSNGAGGFYVTYESWGSASELCPLSEGSAENVLYSNVSSTGSLTGTGDVFNVADSRIINHDTVSDGAGGLISTYVTGTMGIPQTYSMYAVRVGSTSWSDVLIDEHSGFGLSSENPQIVTNGNHGAIILYQLSDGSGMQVKTSYVDGTDGTFTNTQLTNSTGGMNSNVGLESENYNKSIIADGSGGATLTYTEIEGRSWGGNIHIQKVNATNTATLSPSETLVETYTTTYDANPVILPGSAQITWIRQIAGDTSNHVVVGQYLTMDNAPVVSSVDPATGSLEGGTNVTISGNNFVSGDTLVLIGGSTCENVVVSSPMSLTCDTTAHAMGVVEVEVTTSNGSAILTDGYEYGAPCGYTAISGYIATKNDGTVWTWGNLPSQVPGLTNITTVASGNYFKLARKSDGTVWAWGTGTDGQLGNGTNDTVADPVQVDNTNLTTATAVAAGTSHSIALNSDGTVWAWGLNDYGQLGNGNTGTNSNVPVQVSGLTDVTAIAAGGLHSLALKSDGTVWAWGYNQSGELGNSSNANSNVPVQVTGLTDVSSIKSGWSHNLALKTNGTVWAWGMNYSGQLGNNSNVDRNYPVQVSGITTATNIGIGTYTSFASLGDGTFWSWGYGYEGELGTGTIGNSWVPVQVTALTNIIDVYWESSGYAVSALKDDGTAWAWGHSYGGGLGDGINTTSSVPVQVIPPGCNLLAITDLAATGGSGSADLTWTAPVVSGNPVTGYEVHYSNDGFVSDDRTCNSASCTDATEGATVSGLTGGTQYSFRVYTVYTIGTGGASNIVTATPTGLVASPDASKIEIHIQSANVPGNSISTGISDGDTGSLDIDSLGTPAITLIPEPPTAVRYTFDVSGSPIETSVAYSGDDMTGATTVTLNDDALSDDIPIGFEALVFGRVNDTIKISSNGFLYLNQTAVVSTDAWGPVDASMSSVTGSDFLIAGITADLYPPESPSFPNEVRYKIFGTTPNQYMVVEWNDVSPCCDATGGNSFQIKIFETTGGGGGGGGECVADEGDVCTSTNVSNGGPVFAGHASDNGSDDGTHGGAPTNVGTDVTFTATANDPNNDNYYLAICKTGAITAGSSAAPTCPGGAWSISAATASGAAATTTYTALLADVENNGWYAYVCDGNGTPGLCSAYDTGGDNLSNGSPFNVNHVGTYGTVTVTDSSDGTIAPGDTLKFLLDHNTAQIADPDTDPTQDLLSMHVCTEATTAYDYDTNTCTGGATICDAAAVNPVTGDSFCTGGASLVSVPTAHATYHYKVYVEDNHNFPATGTADQTYAVIDVDPVITGWTTADDLIIGAGGSDVIDYIAALSDDNGDQDVTNVEGRFFDKLGGTLSTCTSDEKNCYIQSSCTLGAVSGASSGKTALGTDKDLTATCAATVYFNANASTSWEFHVNPTDSGSVKTGLPDTAVSKTVEPLSALGVTEAAIGYGNVAIGGDSTKQTTTLENQGNQIIDILISGTDMTTGSYSIAAAQQKWNHSDTNFSWDSGSASLVTALDLGTDDAHGCLNRDMQVRADHISGTGSNEAIAWKIRIPSTQHSGAYVGSNTFATAASDVCTGTLN